MVGIMEQKAYSNRKRTSFLGFIALLLIGIVGLIILFFLVEPSLQARGYITVMALGFVGVVISTFAILQISDRRKKKANE
jgi:hypothetical protein